MRIIFLFLFLSVFVRADDWIVAGKTYHNVVVGTIEADKVHITYDGGMGSLSLSDLTPDLQKKFNYDPAKAKAESDAREKARLKAVADAQALAAKYAASAPASTATPSPWVSGPLTNVQVNVSPMAQRAESPEQFEMNRENYLQDQTVSH